MKICAIVLDYRGSARTEACLDSLSRQGLHTVVVVDNSADRQASAALDAVLQRVGEGDAGYRLHLLRKGINLGFARGVNLALDSAPARGCDAYLLINNDARAAPGMVARLAQELADGNADLVAPLVIDDNGAVQPVLWYQRLFGLLTASPLPHSFPYLSGCCLMFRRDLAGSGKLFDEDFFMYGEDTLLGWQLARAGKVARRVEAAVVSHGGRGSSRQGEIFYEYHMARAHVLLGRKACRSRFEVPLFLCARSVSLALRALLRGWRYRSRAPLLAFVLAWFAVDIRAS